MKCLIVFVSSLVVAYGAPTAFIQQHPLVYSAAPLVHAVPVPAISQWHSQDGLGQYSYGYQGGPSAKTEVKTLDGITQGSYSYVDSNNELQTVNYVSDALGFRAAATNLPTPPVDNGVAPEPVEDTVEVKAARAEHLEAVQKAQNGEAPAAPEVAPLEAPEPVEDTVEVKAAKVEHLKAVEEAKVRNSLASDDTETVIAPQTIAVHTAPLHTIQYSSLPVAAPAVVVRSQPQVAAVHLAAASPSYILRAQPQTAFAYSVHQTAGIPHLIAY